MLTGTCRTAGARSQDKDGALAALQPATVLDTAAFTLGMDTADENSSGTHWPLRALAWV